MKTTYFCTSFLLLITHIAHPKVIELSTQEGVDNIIVTPEKKAVIKFSSIHCPPCQRIKEPYKNISEQDFFKDVIFATVDVDTTPNLTQKYNIRSMPSFIYIVDGKQVGMDEGAPDNLEQRIKKKLKLSEPPAPTTESKMVPEEKQPVQKVIEQKEPAVEQTFLEKIQTKLNNFWQWITNAITNLFPGR